MKKLFTLAAVLVAALAMNAAVVYDWAGKVGSQTVTSPDDKITFETGKYNKNATEVDCIKIGSSYKSEIKDGAGNPVLDGEGNKTYKYNYLTIQPAEGGFKKGDVLKFKAFYSHNDAKNVKVWVLDANDTELYLSENGITTIAGVASLTSLRILDVAQNRLSDLTGVEALTNLEEFWCNDNRVEDWDQIKKLQKARKILTVYFEANPIASASDYRDRLHSLLPTLTQIDAHLIK